MAPWQVPTRLLQPRNKAAVVCRQLPEAPHSAHAMVRAEKPWSSYPSHSETPKKPPRRPSWRKSQVSPNNLNQKAAISNPRTTDLYPAFSKGPKEEVTVFPTATTIIAVRARL